MVLEICLVFHLTLEKERKRRWPKVAAVCNHGGPVDRTPNPHEPTFQPNHDTCANGVHQIPRYFSAEQQSSACLPTFPIRVAYQTVRTQTRPQG
ncbi:unnamed protein product [Linum trigynum]|uniref:Uncharacterized protein n=1 Tax=Linum trigynum TaxID=586398 RepID=A0AAV2GV50_9ROSI